MREYGLLRHDLLHVFTGVGEKRVTMQDLSRRLLLSEPVDNKVHA